MKGVSNVRPVTPRGFRDIMPEEALEREQISRTVCDAFAAHGYLPVETPLLEDRASLERASRMDDAPFQLFDSDGRHLMVRSDLTMPIARLVATRLQHASAPFRLRYAAPVVREHAESSSRQSTQLGLELIGEGGVTADWEVLSIAAETLDAIGISGWRIVCGSVKPMKQLLDACGVSSKDRLSILESVHASDFVNLYCRLQDMNLAEEARQALAALPRICGGEEALDEAVAILAPFGIQDDGIANLRAMFARAREAGFADRLTIDFSIMNSFDYYTGLVFSVYADAISASLGSGGRYDDAFSSFGASGLPAAGFSFSLEQLMEAVAAPAEERPLRIAVPKGSLFKETVALLERAGLDVEPLRNPGRHLIIHAEGVDYLIVRPTDAPVFVASGGADCGICGRDSLIEANVDLVQLADLDYGNCRFVVAEPAANVGKTDAEYARRGRIRVATKYPRITQSYYDRIGKQVDIIPLHGNIELAPIVGMSDQIVDITATGTTLRENDLVIVDEVLECSARFFASPARIRCDERVRKLGQALVASRKG